MKLRILCVALALIAAAGGGSTGDSAADADVAPSEEVSAADDEAEEQAETEDPEAEEPVEDSVEEPPADEVTTTSAEPAEKAVETEEVVEEEAVVEVRGLVGPPDSLNPDCSAVPSAQVGLQTGTITSAGLDYDFQLIVPSSYDGSAPIPAVLDFHGLGSNGAQQALFSGVATLAEAEGFLAIEPTGIPGPGDDRASWELPQFDTPGRDDVQMVLDLIDFVSGVVCVDPGRIYSLGMSNGSLFTSELVCDLSERIAAAASIAGVTHDDSCAPTRAVPFLAFHGVDDTTVPFNGGGESDLGPSVFFEQVMPDEFSQFADDFGCTGSEDSSITAEVTRTSYTGCNDDIEVSFYAIAGAGHTWPGSPISAAITSLGVTNTDIDATALAWELFAANSLPGAIEIAEG